MPPVRCRVLVWWEGWEEGARWTSSLPPDLERWRWRSTAGGSQGPLHADLKRAPEAPAAAWHGIQRTHTSTHTHVHPLIPAVDRLFNGEDVLMNFVLANRTAALQRGASNAAPVRYISFLRPKVRWEQVVGGFLESQRHRAPSICAGTALSLLFDRLKPVPSPLPLPPPPASVQRRVDISKLSPVGISHNFAKFLDATQTVSGQRISWRRAGR